MPATNCPYCSSRKMTEHALRAHWALNACGRVPAGTVLPFDEMVREDVWRKEVEAIAREMGLMVAHCERAKGAHGGNSWMTPMAKGWPDTIFLAKRGGMLAVEFKASGGQASPEQVEWINALDRTLGVKGRIMAPADWPVLHGLLCELR